jgi:putative hydrolase of the HAD superfamily
VFDHPVHAVLLDAGGVLLLPDPAAMRRAVAPFGVTPDDDLVWHTHYAGGCEIDRIGHVDWTIADRVIARMFGIPEAQVEDALDSIESVYRSEEWVPIPGVIDALLTLERSGMPLAIVSNAAGTMEQQLLSHRVCAVSAAGAECAEVTIVVDSHVVGIEKPDPRIFDIALGELGAEAEGAVYVGDTVYFDVNGARAAGLTPVHVDPYHLCPMDDHLHIDTLADLVARLVPAS